MAKCPAHDDRVPSLSIAGGDDGRVLVKCFAGCSFDEVIAAIGIPAEVLFPPKAIAHAGRLRRPFIPQQVFERARLEIGVVAVIAADMHENRRISDEDYERLLTAHERLEAIAWGAYGG